MKLSPDLGHLVNKSTYPFSVKPDSRVTPADIMRILRDHFEGTKLDLTVSLEERGLSLCAGETGDVRGEILCQCGRFVWCLFPPGVCLHFPPLFPRPSLAPEQKTPAAGPFGNPVRWTGGEVEAAYVMDGNWDYSISLHRTIWSFICQARGRGCCWEP